MFVQVIRFRTQRIEEIRALIQEYEQQTDRPSTAPIGSEVLQIKADPNSYMVLARFSSAEAARENSARPQTNEWFRKFSALLEGQPEFMDTEQVYEFGAKPAVA